MCFPTIPYPGGKARLAAILAAHLPLNIDTYYDPCVGHGNMFWAAATILRCARWRINDIRTASMFHAINALGDHIVVPERTRREYYRQWNAFESGNQRSHILQPYLSRNGAGYGKGGPCTGNGCTAAGYQKTVRLCRHLMDVTNVQVTDWDWKKVLKGLTEHDFVFFDPPYFGCDVRSYPHDFDHMAMVKLLYRARFRWMLTEYDQSFYRKYFGAPFMRKNVQLLGVNTQDGGPRREECVWKNY
jgi:site-specific DNA-adenine methylase